MATAKNVLGGKLQSCSTDPVTGFYRNGCCDTGMEDRGLHLVCTLLTAEFLAFSKSAGNDLSTPNPMYGFPGLRPGNRWCMCVTRWKEAYDAGVVAPVVMEATHVSALEFVDLETFQKHAAQPEARS